MFYPHDVVTNTIGIIVFPPASVVALPLRFVKGVSWHLRRKCRRCFSAALMGTRENGAGF